MGAIARVRIGGTEYLAIEDDQDAPGLLGAVIAQDPAVEVVDAAPFVTSPALEEFRAFAPTGSGSGSGSGQASEDAEQAAEDEFERLARAAADFERDRIDRAFDGIDFARDEAEFYARQGAAQSASIDQQRLDALSGRQTNRGVSLPADSARQSLNALVGGNNQSGAARLATDVRGAENGDVLETLAIRTGGASGSGGTRGGGTAGSTVPAGGGAFPAGFAIEESAKIPAHLVDSFVNTAVGFDPIWDDPLRDPDRINYVSDWNEYIAEQARAQGVTGSGSGASLQIPDPAPVATPVQTQDFIGPVGPPQIGPQPAPQVGPRLPDGSFG